MVSLIHSWSSMLKIRLKPVGKKRDISYRIIVTEAGKGISSNNYVEQIGFYDPRIDRKDIDVEKATKWIANGAQPSGTVYNLLVDAGVVKGRKKNVLPRKSAPVVDEPEEEKKEEAPAAEAETETEAPVAEDDQSVAEEVAEVAAEEAPVEAVEEDK